MPTAATNFLFQGLARRLVDDGLLSEQDAESALGQSAQTQTPFILYLLQHAMVTARDVALICSHDFGLPILDLDAYDPSFIPNIVSEALIRKHHALPLLKGSYRIGKTAYLPVGISDPSNQAALTEFKFRTGMNTFAILVEEDKLNKLIEEYLSAQENAALNSLDDIEGDLENLDISTENEIEKTSVNEATDDAPVVKYVHKIMLDAIKKEASDIHFEPYERFFRIRFRQDGILYNIANPPLALANKIASRIKIMSQLDIAERRIPQDGRFKLTLSKKRHIDFRISTCPTVSGEKIVMRILDPTSASVGIDALGFEEKQKKLFMENIYHSQGMILVTGPTGSGKTVTLYTALSIRNVPEVNICTVEDPVELNLPGINQVHINLKTGLTFATALRSFLRQDPDIIMVGEMRDLETAEIGIKAAQTGHLVLSTLHTNSAPETLTRLLNMGVAPFNIATSLSLIIAQRLVRTLCIHCKQEEEIPRATLLAEGFHENELTQLKVFAPQGCEHCTNGYKGRTGIFEVLPITSTIGNAIMNGKSSLDIAKLAQAEQILTLRASGLSKVRLGITSLSEINRVTKD